jgi:hypothetical protein
MDESSAIMEPSAWCSGLINRKESIVHVLMVTPILDVVMEKCNSMSRQEIHVGSPTSPDHNGRPVWGMKCLRPLENWDCGFESNSRHGCLFVFILYLC